MSVKVMHIRIKQARIKLDAEEIIRPFGAG